jgi:hypothetical protein
VTPALRTLLLRVGLLMLPLLGGTEGAVGQASQAPDDHAAKPNAISDQNAAQEPSAKTGPQSQSRSDVFVHGVLAVPGASPDTQTTPAKFSARNDARDKIPIMARGPQLDEAQRKLIAAAVRQARAPAEGIAAAPTTELPGDLEVRDWPAGVVENVPAVKGTKYVRLADKILIVQPANGIVVSEFTP